MNIVHATRDKSPLSPREKRQFAKYTNEGSKLRSYGRRTNRRRNWVNRGSSSN